MLKYVYLQLFLLIPYSDVRRAELVLVRRLSWTCPAIGLLFNLVNVYKVVHYESVGGVF